MQGSTGNSICSPRTSSPSSDVILRANADRLHAKSVEKKANRRSVEFPAQRKVYDSCLLNNVVKRSFSFDHQQQVVARICDVVPSSSARKVHLAYSEDDECRVIVDSDKVVANKDSAPLVGGVVCEKKPQGLVSSVVLRRAPLAVRAARCRSSPSPQPRERAPPGRLCRTWYGGYDALVEDEVTFIQQKAPPSATVATCGARRRAEGRRRRAEPVRLSASSTSLNLLPRLSAAVIPLRRKESSLASLHRPAARLARSELARSAAPLLERDNSIPDSPILRKCETVLALTGLEASEPRRPINRLRSAGDQPERVCSRCSSLLSLAASGSRYSLGAIGGFVSVGAPDEEESPILCKLCLEDVPQRDSITISHCGCVFCFKCMKSYAEYEIMNGAYDISCPDSRCHMQGVMLTLEVEKLVSADLIEKHRKFRLNHEVAMDGGRAFCPRAGCETVCVVSGNTSGGSNGHVPIGGAGPPQPVFCPTCSHHFCSNCTNKWHAGMDCAAYIRQMALDAGAGPGGGAADGLVGITGDSDLIKWCPMCRVPIEKDEGCAQMMCKRCKHVFCWYCLASLDDDFLLRHYDKGPCKNKLGHSRASVIWHRAQVVGIFAGFGLLLLVASPLLLLAAPCIVCCKCRLCNTNGKTVDSEEAENMDLEAEFANDDIQRVTTPVSD